MKKNIVLFISLTLLTASFTSCSPNFVPSDDLDYFRIDDVYRVIELSEAKNDARTTIPVAGIGPSFIAAPFSATTVIIDFEIDQAATFFKVQDNLINKDGALLVSKLLDLNVSDENFNNFSYVNNVIKTYSYNKRISKSPTQVTFAIESPSEELNACIAGYMAEVVETTFLYYDLNVNTGERLESGTFSVYTMVSDPYLDLYYYQV